MEDQWLRDWLEDLRQDQRRRTFDEFLARSRQRHDRQAQDWLQKVRQDRQDRMRKLQQDFRPRRMDLIGDPTTLPRPPKPR